MRWFQVLPRVGSNTQRGLAETLSQAPWFILEYWRLDGKLRVYLAGQVSEAQLRRYAGVRPAEPPGLEGLYAAELRQPRGDWWEPLEARGFEAVFDWLCEGCGVQVAAWRDHRAVKALQARAAELRGKPPGALSAIAKALVQELDRATRADHSMDPLRAERLRRMYMQGGRRRLRGGGPRRYWRGCARTGAGKSTLLLNLALRLWQTGKAAVFVIDPHGDLARDIVEAAPSLERVYYLDAGGRDFAVNPLEPPRLGDPELARSIAVDNTVAVLEKVLRLPETAVNVKFIVRTLLYAMYSGGPHPPSRTSTRQC